MKGGNEFYDVVQMAQLLFNDTSAACCYASHRLLNEDRTYFKQAGRIPPVFAARPDKDVITLIARQEAEAQVRRALMSQDCELCVGWSSLHYYRCRHKSVELETMSRVTKVKRT